LKENFPEDGSLAVENNRIINLAKQTNRSFSFQTQLLSMLREKLTKNELFKIMIVWNKIKL
jgi:hypothetical protein